MYRSFLWFFFVPWLLGLACCKPLPAEGDGSETPVVGYIYKLSWTTVYQYKLENRRRTNWVILVGEEIWNPSQPPIFLRKQTGKVTKSGEYNFDPEIRYSVTHYYPVLSKESGALSRVRKISDTFLSPFNEWLESFNKQLIDEGFITQEMQFDIRPPPATEPAMEPAMEPATEPAMEPDTEPATEPPSSNPKLPPLASLMEDPLPESVDLPPITNWGGQPQPDAQWRNTAASGLSHLTKTS